MYADIHECFFALARAGLWERDVELQKDRGKDISQILRYSQEQSVVGLVADGLERVKDVNVPQTVALTFAGEVLQIEQRNKTMNAFVAELIERLRKADVYAVLVKGQGIAQCYERPLWRSPGDVDLLLSDTNYEKAKKVLIPFASSVETEFVFLKHIGMTIDGWEVELHGTQRPRLTRRIDLAVDVVQKDVFYGGKVRSWMNGRTQVFLPAPDEDVIFVFTHILHHYYQGGIGLRQICDWCRLLWTYRDSLDVALLENRLRKMGLMSEWRAFGAYAVDYLGLPAEAMPLYSTDARWSKIAHRINDFVMEVGNFGHKRAVTGSEVDRKGLLVRKAASLWRRTADSFRHFVSFPGNSLKIWWYMMRTGFMVVMGE